MSVRKRRTTKGETEEYHYDFMQGGKRYRGVCEGCTTQKAAMNYEKELIESIKRLSSRKTQRAVVEECRDILLGSSSIPLDKAYDLSLQKPRRRKPSETIIRIKRAYWNDFVAFMKANYPDVLTLSNVLRKHAEAYINQLRTDGRFDKNIAYGSKNMDCIREYQTKNELSNRTVNVYHQTLAEVFTLLANDAGIVENPFSSIPKLSNDAETREAFTEDELATIWEKADPFILPLFKIAISTALREGDICTLKWSDIDFNREVIVKRMNKTGNFVEIPMMPYLKSFLLDLQQVGCKDKDWKEYVLPEQAKMYSTNNSGISYRIKQFLEEKCSIKTTRQVEGRSRSVSVKDLHSCRHTFCYFAGLYNIPLNVVQSIVGHMTPEMTKHYSAHVNLEAKREKMKNLPGFMTTGKNVRTLKALPAQVTSKNDGNAIPVPSLKRRALQAQIDQLPEEKLQAVIDFISNMQ